MGIKLLLHLCVSLNRCQICCWLKQVKICSHLTTGHEIVRWFWSEIWSLCGAVVKKELSKNFVQASFVWELVESFFKCLSKSFRLAIWLRMIRSCCNVVDTFSSAKALEMFRNELRTVVWDNCFWISPASNLSVVSCNVVLCISKISGHFEYASTMMRKEKPLSGLAKSIWIRSHGAEGICHGWRGTLTGVELLALPLLWHLDPFFLL